MSPWLLSAMGGENNVIEDLLYARSVERETSKSCYCIAERAEKLVNKRGSVGPNPSPMRAVD